MKKKFYEKTWFIVLMSIFVPPVGLCILLFIKKDLNKLIKFIVCAFLAFWSLIWIIAVFVPADENTDNSVTTTQPTAELSASISEKNTEAPTEQITTTEELTTEERITIEETATHKEEATKTQIEKNTTSTKPTTTKAPTTTKVASTKPSTTKTATTKAPTTTQKTTTTKPVETTKKEVQSESYYVLNTNTHKFHRPSCRHVSSIHAENYSESSSSSSSIISNGYEPCGTCKP